MKTYRRKLIETIVSPITEDYLFDNPNGLKKDLQEKLDLNFKFKTMVSDINENNGKSFFQVFFEEEDGTKRSLDINILRTGKNIGQF